MPSPPDLPHEDLSWYKNGEPASGSAATPPDSTGVVNRPVKELLDNDKFLRSRVNTVLDQLALREPFYVYTAVSYAPPKRFEAVILCQNGAGALNIQLPDSTGALTRLRYTVKKLGGTGLVTVLPPAGRTIDGQAAFLLVDAFSSSTIEVPIPPADPNPPYDYFITAEAGAGRVGVGMIIDIGHAVVPLGYLLCDGSAVSRTTYANLFAKIGVTFGPGDGTTTFNLPDSRGRATVGAGTGAGLTNRVLGSVGGSETTILALNQIPTHNHDFAQTAHGHSGSHAASHTHGFNRGIGMSEAGNDGPGGGDYEADGDPLHILPSGMLTATIAGATANITFNAQGGNQPHTNMQPWIAANKIIKY